MATKGTRDQVGLALQVAAASGFVGSAQSIQTSCLSLCNACRESVPVPRLRINSRVPPSILANIYPGLQQAGTKDASRVCPPTTVLSVHWTFATSPTFGSGVFAVEPTEQETCDTDVLDWSNANLGEVRWPQGTCEIALCAFNRPLYDVILPRGLERLWFGEPNVDAWATCMIPETFDQPLQGVTFPCGLREIFLGGSFNQRLEDTAWPGELERLSLPGYNQPLRDVQWPPMLKALEFVSPSRIQLWENGGTVDDFFACHPASMRGRTSCFNQPLDTALPPSLETLWLSREFNQPLDGVGWPTGILTLGLAFDLDGYRFKDSITYPATVRNLMLVEMAEREMRLPNGVKTRTLLRPRGLTSSWDSSAGVDCLKSCYALEDSYLGCECYRCIDY